MRRGLIIFLYLQSKHKREKKNKKRKKHKSKKKTKKTPETEQEAQQQSDKASTAKKHFFVIQFSLATSKPRNKKSELPKKTHLT